MNQSNFSLADLFIILGALVFGFFFFLSLNFFSLGDIRQSIILAGLISFLLGSLAFGAKLLKQTSRNFKTCVITETLLIVVFIFIAFIVLITFTHYFTVSARKAEIQQKILLNITQAEDMFNSYEGYADNRLDIYRNRLESVVQSRPVNPEQYFAYGFVAGTNHTTQIDNKVFILRSMLYRSNYEEIKQVNSNWLKNSKGIIARWSPTGIVKVMNSLEDEIRKWQQQLIEFSSFRAEGEIAETFDYPLSFDSVSKEFTERGKPNILSIALAVGLYLIILLSYFIAKRHTRYPGLKVIFARGAVKDNEL